MGPGPQGHRLSHKAGRLEPLRLPAQTRTSLFHSFYHTAFRKTAREHGMVRGVLALARCHSVSQISIVIVVLSDASAHSYPFVHEFDSPVHRSPFSFAPSKESQPVPSLRSLGRYPPRPSSEPEAQDS